MYVYSLYICQAVCWPVDWPLVGWWVMGNGYSYWYSYLAAAKKGTNSDCSLLLLLLFVYKATSRTALTINATWARLAATATTTTTALTTTITSSARLSAATTRATLCNPFGEKKPMQAKRNAAKTQPQSASSCFLSEWETVGHTVGTVG